MNTMPMFIAPERLYTLRGFREARGISQTRMREARIRGIELPALSVGCRKFVRGFDAIAFIERLAAAQQLDIEEDQP